MKYIMFDMGPFRVYSYGFMISLGIILGFLLICFCCNKKLINPDFIYNIGFWGIFAGFVGSKVLFWITILDEIFDNPKLMLELTNGFVVYGGLIGGFIGAWGYCKYKRLDWIQYFSCAAPGLALAQGFGRIGCFFAGCCYGAPTDSFIGMQFNDSPFAPHGVDLIPTQLFSAAFDFLLALVLVMVLKKEKTKGMAIPTYIIAYSIGRFIIEFFRMDPRGFIGALSTSQFISIFTLIFGIGFLIFLKKQTKKDLFLE